MRRWKSECHQNVVTYTELSQKKWSENVIPKLIWLSSATVSPVTRGINKPSIIMSHRDWSSRAVQPVRSYCFVLFLQELVWVWEGYLETLFIHDKELVRKQLREGGYDLDVVWACPLRAYLLTFNSHCVGVEGYNSAWLWFRGRTYGKWLWFSLMLMILYDGETPEEKSTCFLSLSRKCPISPGHSTSKMQPFDPHLKTNEPK